MAFSIPVTLTSVKNPADKRYLVVDQGTSTLIGRASKSESKNLQPAATNALFDCPVISREHAELKASKFALAGEQITITDKNSMHGTHVNGRKLEKFVPFTLRSGDRLQFGTRVTRGPDTHDGVYVTFDCDKAKSTSSKFVVPDVSEDELSEDEISSGSQISDEEEPEEVSSAKTTPEQAKSQPGSSQQPIDLTGMPPPPPPRPSFINLVDDARDDLYNSTTYRPQSPIYSPVYPTHRNIGSPQYKLVEDDDYEPSQSPYYSALSKAPLTKTIDLIQDSVDKDADVLVPESVPFYRLDSMGGDDDSVLDHNTGLTGLLNKQSDAASEHDVDDGESHAEAEEDDMDADQDEEEDEDEDFDEDAERLSDSDASDLYGELLDEDFEELNTYSAKKHVSPELTSAIPAKSAPTTQAPFKIGSQWTSGVPVKPATQPYYDPVRASHSNGVACGNLMYPPPPKATQAPSTSAYRPYTYATPIPLPQYSSGLAYPNTDMSSSSRWDVPPAPSYSYPTYVGPAPLSSRPYAYGCNYPGVYQDNEPRVNDYPAAFKDLEESLGLRKPFDGIEKQVAVEAAANKSMKISDMVEKAADTMKDAIDDAEKTILTASKKRRADEMDKEESGLPTAVIAEQPLNVATVAGAVRNEVDKFVQEPRKQRRKIEEPATTNSARNVAGGIAKYATAAAVGGAGTVAFLCSPLMERLLEWMA